MLLRLVLVALLVVGSIEAAAPPPIDGNLDGAMARFGTTRFRHATVVPRVVWSRDGNLIVTGSHLGTIRIWEPRSGRLLRQFNAGGPISAMAISPDGKRLATGSMDGTIRHWLLQPLRAVLASRMHRDEVCGLCYSPDGKMLASCGKDGIVRLADADKGNTIRQLSAHLGREVRAVTFSHDGKRLATCGADNLVKIWDAASDKLLLTLNGHTKMVMSVTFSLDDKTLASTAHDGTTRLWDVAAGKPSRVFRHVGFGEMVEFSPDGRRLLVSQGWGNVVALYDLESPDDKPRWEGKIRHSLAVAFSPDGNKVVGTGWESTVRIWDAATGREEGSALLPGHANWVYAVAPLADGRIASAGSDGRILVWSPEGELQRQIEVSTEAVNCLAVSPEGSLLASGGRDGNVRLWNVNTGEEINKFVAGGSVKSLSFSPDGKRLASASGNDEFDLWINSVPGHNASVWDVTSGSRLELLGHKGGVNAIVFAPDGKTLATVGNDETVRFWDSLRGKEVRRLPTADVPIECLAFSPDGTTLACGGKGGIVQLWDVANERLLRELQVSNDWIVRMAFSPDGRMLATAIRQDVQQGFPVRIWDVATGMDRTAHSGHQGTAFGIAFVDEGRTIVTGGADGCVALWDVTRGQRYQKSKPTVAALKTAWKDLIGNDGQKMHRAVLTLCSSPEFVLPLLRDTLKPVPSADPKLIEKLILDLDDEEFSKRQQATEALERFGDPAEPALRKVFEEGSAEASGRAGRLLDLLEAKAGSERRLREVRGVEILERIGNTEARRLLQTLAGGAAEAAVTRDARAALARLAK